MAQEARARHTLIVSLFIVIALFGTTALSAGRKPSSRAAKPQSKASAGVMATVTTDGALVLIKPDLDSGPIAQYEAGKRIRVSKGTTSGEVKFRKTRVGGRIGYIADIDVRVGAAPAVAAKGGKGVDKKPTRKKETSAEKEREPVYFARFVGLILGFSEFKEGIDGVDASASMPFYGLKITGPDVLVSGPVIDFNLLLHYGAPSYYDALSAIRPSGFVLLTDALLRLPILAGQNGLLAFGLGPMLMFSQFSVSNAGRSQSLTEINLGVSLNLGVTYRIEKVGLGLEAKYFIEKQSYRGLFASLQTQF